MAKKKAPATTTAKKKKSVSPDANSAKPADVSAAGTAQGFSQPPAPARKKAPPEVDFEEMAHTAEAAQPAEERSAKEEAAPIDADPTPASGMHNVFLHGEIPPMYIVHITPEMSPVAKVGGLADVVFGLTWELQIRGHAVETILPKYNNMRYDHIYGLERCFDDLWVPWHEGAVHCSVYFGFVYGRKCFFIEPHSHDCFFDRNKYYGDHDDVYRFAFFSRAAMEFLLKSGKRPNVIHCHDWQTGLVPVYQWEIYHRLGMHDCRVAYTIHNFRHQGVCGPQVLDAAGLHRHDYYFDKERLGDYNHDAINLMKGGIVYSNFVTTVSPTHAGEARDKGQGFGLEPALHVHGGKYGGVLNGIDYEVWNPESDKHIPAHYGPESIDKKYDNKRALREALLLADNEKPIISFVGRLDPQKGLELIRHALFYCVNHGAQFILLGSSPDPSIDSYFWRLKGEINENPDSHIEIGFNEELAHLIYAGSDMMVVPSRYEPCGLTQLIAMRYGTVPLVRSVGGLADTVFDKDFSDRPLDQRNGYVFHNDDYGGIESALSRAISCYYQFPDHFRSLMLNGMGCDYSWNVPGQHYLNIYNYIRAK